MAIRRTSNERREQSRRRQSANRLGASSRHTRKRSHPPASTGTEVVETLSSEPTKNGATKVINILNAEDNGSSSVAHSQVHKSIQVGKTNCADITLVDGNAETEDHGSEVTSCCEGVKQNDLGKKPYTSPEKEKNPTYLGTGRFPKPPSCRTIQIGRGKKNVDFYFSLARKFLKKNEMIELSGMGRAIPVVILLAELIQESGFAEKDHHPLPFPKGKLQIWMVNANSLATANTKKVGESVSAEAKQKTKERSYTIDAANNQNKLTHHSDYAKGAIGRSTAELSDTERSGAFRKTRGQAASNKSTDGKGVDKKSIGSDVSDEQLICTKEGCESATDEKDEGCKFVYGEIDDPTEDNIKVTDEQFGEGKTDDRKTDENKIADDPKVKSVLDAAEVDQTFLVPRDGASFTRMADDQTFLATGRRSSFAGSYTSRTNVPAGVRTFRSAGTDNGATSSCNSAVDGTAPGTGALEPGTDGCWSILSDTITNMAGPGEHILRAVGDDNTSVGSSPASGVAPRVAYRVHASEGGASQTDFHTITRVNERFRDAPCASCGH